MTQIDEQIESDLLDMWLLWERGNWYLNDDHPNYDKEHDRRFRDAIVEYITKLIANQVREELTNLKIARLNLDKITTDHADGYQMAVDDMNRHIDNRIKELKGN